MSVFRARRRSRQKPGGKGSSPLLRELPMAVTATRHDDGGQCPSFSQLAKFVREANLLEMAGRSGRKSAVEVTNVGKFGIIAVPADLPYAFAVCDYLVAGVSGVERALLQF